MIRKKFTGFGECSIGIVGFKNGMRITDIDLNPAPNLIVLPDFTVARDIGVIDGDFDLKFAGVTGNITHMLQSAQSIDIQRPREIGNTALVKITGCTANTIATHGCDRSIRIDDVHECVGTIR